MSLGVRPNLPRLSLRVGDIQPCAFGGGRGPIAIVIINLPKSLAIFD